MKLIILLLFFSTILVAQQPFNSGILVKGKSKFEDSVTFRKGIDVRGFGKINGDSLAGRTWVRSIMGNIPIGGDFIPYTGAHKSVNLNAKTFTNWYGAKASDSTARYQFSPALIPTSTVIDLTIPNKDGTILLNDDTVALFNQINLKQNIIPNLEDTSKYYKKSSLAGDTTDKWAAKNHNQPISSIITLRDSLKYLHLKTATFDTTIAIPSYLEGNLFWDSSNKTLTLQSGYSASLQIGQEMYILVQNNTGSTITNGKAVYIYAAGGDIPRVRLSDSTYASTVYKTIAVTTSDIANGSMGFVTTYGKVHDLNTTGLEDKEVYVLSNGTWGIKKPKHAVRLGFVTYGHSSNGILFVSVHKESSTNFSVLNNNASKWIKLDTLELNTKGISIYKEDSIVATKLAVDAKINTKTTVNASIGYLPYVSATGTLSTSTAFLSGTSLGINQSSPTASLDIKGTGATSATFGLKVSNGTPVNLLSIRDDAFTTFGALTGGYSTIVVGNASTTIQGYYSAGVPGLVIGGGPNAGDNLKVTSSSSGNWGNGANSCIRANGGYIPTTGSTPFSYLLIDGIINQTGTNTSPVYGLNISNTLTSAINYNAVGLNNNIGMAINHTGSARSSFGGSVHIKDTIGILKEKHIYFRTTQYINTISDFRFGRNNDTLKIGYYNGSSWLDIVKFLPTQNTYLKGYLGIGTANPMHRISAVGSDKPLFNFARSDIDKNRTDTITSTDSASFSGNSNVRGDIRLKVTNSHGDTSLLLTYDKKLIVSGLKNGVQIDSLNGIILKGSATVYEDLRVNLNTRTAGAAPTYTSGFAGNANLYSWNYSGVASTVNNQYAEIQMPHTWAGDTIWPHFHWSPTTTGTGTVVWNIEYTMVSINGTFGGSNTLSTTYTINANEQWRHEISGTTAPIIPSASQNGISSVLIVRIYRDAATDTYAGDVALLQFDIHYKINSMGSKYEFIK